jgi:glyoxylase I family protein
VKPIGVHHVAITVPDTDEALRFYVDVLGLHQREDRPDFGIGGAWLDAGGQQIHLIQGTPPESKGQHFALWFDDLDGVVGELRALGLEVRDPGGVGADRATFVTDPAGNAVELHEVGTAS